MGIKAAYMVPHPPLIVPSVGRGGEDQIKETTASYERVAEEIAKIAPDTIVILSPHSVMYTDYFHISPGKGARGDFGNFRAPDVSFDEAYDDEFVRALTKLASYDAFPAGTQGERDKELDHGTMVPLYFIRKHYKSGKIVRIGLSGLSLEDHYKLGKYIKYVSDTLGRKTVVVASGDLSHKLQEYGPYGFDPAGPVYDEKIMEAAKNCDFEGMLKFDEDLMDNAAECGHRSFCIMAGTFDGYEVKSEVLSHQDVTGVGYGICIFEPVKLKEGSPYVRLARATIEHYVKTHKRLKFPEDLPEGLEEALPSEATTGRAGAFVSVHKNGMLRGCIGTIGPTEPMIAQEIISNGISAVSRDPRFDPVTSDELEQLEINVDILMEPEYIDGPDKLDVKRYGVIVSCGGRRGLLLPDLDGVDTVEEQIDIAMRKGGIDPYEDYRLQRFEVIRYK